MCRVRYFFHMQFISASLLNNVLILIFLIDTLIVEQTTIYIERKKAIRITISFKCIDSIKLNFTDLIYIFFSFTIFFKAVTFRFLNIIFIFSLMISRNICRKSLKEILNSLRNRISIEVFNIYLIMSTKFDCFLNIWASLLNRLKISNVLNEILILTYLTF